MKKSVIFVSIAAVILAIGLSRSLRWLSDNKISNFDGRVELFVTPATTAEDILARIMEDTVVRRPGSLARAFKEKNVAAFKHTGHYVIEPGSTSVYVARMLNNGWQTPVSLTLSGSLKLKDRIADRIGAQLMLEPSEVFAALNDAAFLEKYGFTPATAFALIIPDTYQVYWDISIDELFDRFRREYDRFWTADRTGKAKQLGLTPLQAGILASIVRAESNYVPELPKIAGVYLNRLKRGMLLQADPTVAFCYDYKLNRVLRKHLQVNSPYNTYKYAGLPPGPICVAPAEYIDAVLNPDYGGGNLYFCANADFSGTHLFAATFAGHAANARAYQKELNRRAAEKRRAAKNK